MLVSEIRTSTPSVQGIAWGYQETTGRLYWKIRPALRPRGAIDSFGLVFFIFRDLFLFFPTYELKVLRIF
jgi:hypothetical protein